MPQHYYHRQPGTRQRPASHGHRQARTSAYAPNGSVPRSLNETQIQPMYPGVDLQYPGFAEVEASGLVPYGQGASSGGIYGSAVPVSAVTPAPAPASSGSSGFSLANLGELKGMIDRFGGIDGIMNGVAKMQKVVGGIQQMAPMMKLVMGILPFGKNKNTSAEADADYEEYSQPKSRKRRKKTTGTQRKRTSAPARRKTASAKPRPKRRKS
ncbi:MAG: tyrosine protein kinase [Paenibacillus sp.]|uniref:tyrosine protein kinase n=1 Tax=Paenibacillus sp. TaxID=58172 RepID=UPI0025E7F1BC|nr:tyrosine protein kinase [Paenibacillus sp.]MBR2565990.1 tyrosine protein kinase [Paenibacillus sp.]